MLLGLLLFRNFERRVQLDAQIDTYTVQRLQEAVELFAALGESSNACTVQRKALGVRF